MPHHLVAGQFNHGGRVVNPAHIEGAIQARMKVRLPVRVLRQFLAALAQFPVARIFQCVPLANLVVGDGQVAERLYALLQGLPLKVDGEVVAVGFDACGVQRKMSVSRQPRSYSVRRASFWGANR